MYVKMNATLNTDRERDISSKFSSPEVDGIKMKNRLMMKSIQEAPPKNIMVMRSKVLIDLFCLSKMVLALLKLLSVKDLAKKNLRSSIIYWTSYL